MTEGRRTEKDKAAQRTTLIFQFGKLLAPLYDLAEKSPPPPASEFQIATARCLPDSERWNEEVNHFATFGDYRLGHLANDIMREPHNLLHSLPELAKGNSDDASRQAILRERLKTCRESVLASIDLVPIEWTARLHEAQTPFSVYLKIRDAIGTAKTRIHYFDRYLDTEFFHLYMRDLSRALEVRLVTTKGKQSFGVANVLAVSRLAAGEFANYQLIECLPADLHDRNLRVDNNVFFLGTSIRDAGTCPTNFSPADSTAMAHAVLDGMIAKGTVIT
jgi:hypothetical protein